MLVLDDEEGRAAALAGDLHERLEALGVYEPEREHVAPAPDRACVSASALGCSRPCRSWSRSCRPTLLFTFHGYAPMGREYEVLESVAARR